MRILNSVLFHNVLFSDAFKKQEEQFSMYFIRKTYEEDFSRTASAKEITSYIGTRGNGLGWMFDIQGL